MSPGQAGAELCRLAGEDLGYGRTTILPAVRFALAAGERVVLLGRSGAGKSTLLTALYHRLSASGTRIALVPQDHALVPPLSVFHNVHMGRLDAHGALVNLAILLWPSEAARRGVAPALAAVGLAAEARRPVASLSGGQKQRVALARAFHRGGAVLIGDEPVSAVDETQARHLLDDMTARFSTTILALHDVAIARRHATRLVGLRGGRIVFDAPPAEIDAAAITALYAA